MSRSQENKAYRYCKALDVAIRLAENPLLIADLAELRDKLATGQLQWRSGAQCIPNNRTKAIANDR
jgi:hypothetical protein